MISDHGFERIRGSDSRVPNWPICNYDTLHVIAYIQYTWNFAHTRVYYCCEFSDTESLSPSILVLQVLDIQTFPMLTLDCWRMHLLLNRNRHSLEAIFRLVFCSATVSVVCVKYIIFAIFVGLKHMDVLQYIL